MKWLVLFFEHQLTLWIQNCFNSELTAFVAKKAEELNKLLLMDSHYNQKEKRYDPETGLCYFPYRYYAPQMGRWISIDPCACEGEESYVYCDRDPLRYFDPDGRFFVISIPLAALTWAVVGEAVQVAVISGVLYWAGNQFVNFNLFEEPVAEDTYAVDPYGNVFPLSPGQMLDRS